LKDTEKLNPAAKNIDALSVSEVLGIMHKEDSSVLNAVGAALKDIEGAAKDATRRIREGGRVFYIGAGTSGRLGVLDAAEIYPTFGASSFFAIMAGGDDAVTRAVEGAEDDEDAARIEAGAITGRDMAIGITASGRTPFVLAALEKAHSVGARCWLLTCNETEKPPFIDGTIILSTGPELVAGSTRLKAATATKLALNMISTATMIGLGGVYDGLMVDVVPSNKKLIARAEGIIMRITGCSLEEASKLLRESGMRPKTASLMKLKGLSKGDAEQRLEKAGGSLRKALAG
jgi:N-acetylmuramic acid 6-phosphate etherase